MNTQHSLHSKPHFDVERVRSDFPILYQQVRGKSLVYLDNAATSQKPYSVIERVDRYYREENANIHRGVHMLSERATDAYEAARAKIQEFFNISKSSEVIFVRGTTEAINLVASSFGRSNLKAGDEILITEMEHHSNIVPWQLLCEQSGAVLKVLPITDQGELCMDQLPTLLGDRTRLVSVVHISNALGTVNPIKEIIRQAHRVGAKVLIDGAQAAPHQRVDIQDLDCDFYALSGHKLFGPTGIGVLFGKESILETMPPYQGGGDMIRQVTFSKSTYNDLPYKFEAGTPHIAGAIGLGAAIDYLNSIDWEAVACHEQDLLTYAEQALGSLPGLRLIGQASHKASVVSFVMDGIHPHDIGTILDEAGIAIRTGHHCAMPLMQRMKVPATARASMAFYNRREEIDVLAASLEKVREVFS